MYISFSFSISINFIVPYLFISSFSPTHLNLNDFTFFFVSSIRTLQAIHFFTLTFDRTYLYPWILSCSSRVCTRCFHFDGFNDVYFVQRPFLKRAHFSICQTNLCHSLAHFQTANASLRCLTTYLATGTQMLFEHHHLRRMRRRERERRIEAILVCLFQIASVNTRSLSRLCLTFNVLFLLPRFADLRISFLRWFIEDTD